MRVRLYAVAAAFVTAALFSIPSQAQFDGDVTAGKAKAQAAGCAGCHGMDGNLSIPQGNAVVPKLAGQIPEYLYKQLQDYKSGARRTPTSPVMNGMAAPLSEKDMKNLAAYFASQKLQVAGVPDQQALQAIQPGERLYRGGNAKTGVSACMSCHGPSGHGIPPGFPRVTGQAAEYTRSQLLSFKNGERTNDGGIMTKIAFRMSQKEIDEVSRYMAVLH